MNSMDYSCWCSHLNQTTRIAWSSNPFATELPSLLQVKWYSTCLLEIHFWIRNLPKPRVRHFIPLSWFILLTIDGQYFYSKNYLFCRAIHSSFTKIKNIFCYSKFFWKKNKKYLIEPEKLSWLKNCIRCGNRTRDWS